ncbi:helix-turn-helix domain-containing protein [Streptomyces olivoreticuli]|uniref:MmyB family transcriptional regulator n=1 Tax=Streptomyces olivoreticuli TaxID=68246 RepID=UPI0013C2CBBC|nr:helix-turn-helix domain-containing protein [Streptomyces olivoreticuli]
MSPEHPGGQGAKNHLRELLRQCRARLGPDDRASRGPARRRPGISQESTAALLGCSTRWYATLESGRMDHPTREFLEGVARALRMNCHERQALFVYATGRLPPPDDFSDAPPHPDWDTLVQSQPQPSCIYTRSWRLVAANADYLDLFYGDARGGVAGLDDRNILRRVLLNRAPHLPRPVAWKEGWAIPMLGELRAAIAESPDSRELRALLHGLLADPVVAGLWNDAALLSHTHPDGDTRAIDHPWRGRVEFTMLAANLMDARGLRFVTLMTSGPVSADAAPAGAVPGGNPGRVGNCLSGR